MRSVGLATAALLLWTHAAAFAADPVGTYTVAGANPGGGSSYQGDVTVTRTGDTYKVVWSIGGETYLGTGIGNDEFITVSFKSGNNTGVALYSKDKDGWKGIWTFQGGSKVGTESWARK